MINPQLKKFLLLLEKTKPVYFKCEHIFAGENKNVDLLFTNENYEQAAIILENNGFKLYLSEQQEKYKRLYVTVFKGVLYSIHLHKEIAWHGLIALDKQEVLNRAQKNKEGFLVPSTQDSLLIHTAHVLFENFKIRERDKDALKVYLKKKKDKKYLIEQLKKAGWYTEYKQLLKLFEEDKQPSFILILQAYVSRLKKTPLTSFTLVGKLLKALVRNYSLTRKGLLIAFVGVNGAGKSTVSEAIAQKYKHISSFFHGQNTYYFGWNPFLPTTKLLSWANKKQHKQTFHIEKDNKEVTITIKDELLFIYNYIEYLARYLWFVYPQLRKGKVVISDRYFYGLYGQHATAPQSKVLKTLIKLFPKPNYTFVLDAPVETLLNREKHLGKHITVKKSSKRSVHPTISLKRQKERFLTLVQLVDGLVVDTSEPLDKISNEIIERTWRKIIKK